MSWSIVTDNWRMKLLAVGLAVLMLAAVAFSQNPPTSGTLTVGVVYKPGSNIVLINPPPKIGVTFTGLADVIKNVNTSNTVADVDATHARPGAAVRLPVTVSSSSGAIFQNPPSIVVMIDTRQSKDVPVVVSARPASGWTVDQTKTVAQCPPKTDPCTVHFDGPAGWENSLVASITVPGEVNYTGPSTVPNLTIRLQNSNGVLDLTCRTVPCATIDVAAATAVVVASPGLTISTVPLVDAPYSHGPANGYHVTGITITPGTVVVSGDPTALGRIQRITLPALDLSNRTSDTIFQVAIPYPDGVTSNVSIAMVKYTISPDSSVSPSP